MSFIVPQLFPIPFSAGIDGITDPKQVMAGQLLELENGQFSNIGQINKRYGYDILSTTIQGGGNNFNSAAAISSFKKELCLFDDQNIFAYLPSTSNWINRGTAISVIASNQQILRTNDTQQLNPDIALLNGLEIYVWEDESGSINYSIIDAETKTFIVSNVEANTSGVKPKAIAFGGLIYLFYTDSINNLFYNTINPSQPTTLGAQHALVTDGYTAFSYDLNVIGTQLFLGYLADDGYVGGRVKLNSYNTSATLVGSVDVDHASASTAGRQDCFSIVGDVAQNVWISWGSGTKVRSACYTYILNTILSSHLVDTQRINTITSIVDGNTNLLNVFYEIYDPISYNTRTKGSTISQSGTVATIGTIRSVGLASKAFSIGDKVYINTTFQTALQSTYFTHLVNSDFDPNIPVIAKINDKVGGGLRTNFMLSETIFSDTNVVVFANLVKGKNIAEAHTFFSLLGVNSTSLDFQNSNKFLSATHANCLLFVGGILQTYDGVKAVEVGYHYDPENSAAVPSGGDGYLSTGSYQYMITYESTDNIGQIARSAPDTLTIDVVANNHVALTIPTLRLTSKSNVNIVIYRSIANQSAIFYRVTSTIAPLQNDPTIDSVIFVDVLSDADITANEPIYTQGGVLANSAPPACSLISLYQNRVFLGGLEDQNLLWFSKNRFDNTNFNTIPTEFSNTFTVGVDARGGAITALGLLDDKLVIFKRSAVFILTGDGPNDTGGGDQFQDPVFLTSDVGCKNPNSVVTTPVGLMFQSDKGIYLLDRSGQMDPVGIKVKQFNDLTISSATLNQQDNQVIFTTSDGKGLVYDYLWKNWTTWTNHEAADSDVFEQNLCFVKANGKVYVQNRTKFTDGSAPVYLSWTSPNFNFAGLQGYQQVFRVYLLGSFKGDHTLTVDVAYDFNSAYTESTTITPTNPSTVWGADSFWGSNTVWGGEYVIYEFEVGFKTQKCTSIRLRVSDAQTSNYNEGYAISGMTFEIGVLPGANRLPKTQQYGSE